MSVTVTIPEGFQYVGAALLTTVVLLQGLGNTVSRYRKRAGVPYPQMYAEKAEAEKSKDAHLFNCAQRAHQNTLEQFPTYLVAVVISGLKYPVPTAIAATLWNISRVTYARGYLSGDPSKRTNFGYLVGALSAVGMLGSAIVATGIWIKSGLKL